jgi:aldehyde dehydrogenase (NAD+)
VIWKPSEKTPLTALATHAILERALARFGDAPEGLCSVILGGRDAGERLVRDPCIAAGQRHRLHPHGQAVAPIVAGRFGRSILELGGNNAMIVTPSAPTCRWPFAPSSSRRPARRASAARPCAA